MSCSEPLILLTVSTSLKVIDVDDLCLPDWDDSRQEITHFDCVVSFRVEEIQSILLFVDVVGVPRYVSLNPSYVDIV